MRWCRSTARAAAATGDRRPRPNRIANFAIANADFASAAKPRKHDEGGAGHRHLSQNTEYRSRPLPLPVGRLLFPCSALCAGPKLLRCTKTSKTHRCCRNRLVREISSKPFGIPYGRWLRERVNRAGRPSSLTTGMGQKLPSADGLQTATNGRWHGRSAWRPFPTEKLPQPAPVSRPHSLNG